MSTRSYCWRCRLWMPMLNEEEWERLAPLMTLDTQTEALDLYRTITGERETVFNALWHHRASLYGPDCETCGRPLRTSKAKFCAECGVPRGSKRETGAPIPRPFQIRVRAPAKADSPTRDLVLCDYRTEEEARADLPNLNVAMTFDDDWESVTGDPHNRAYIVNVSERSKGE